MRLIFLSKCLPQQRDLMKRPFGRFYHLPVELAAIGHMVQVILCSHRRQPSANIERAGVRWQSHDLRLLGFRGLIHTLSSEVEYFKPDWIITFSDAWYGVLGHHLAKRVRAKLAVDAYDNYEAYMPWNLPLHWLWRRSVRKADLVTAAGPQLAQLMQSYRRAGHPVEILPMSADPEFVPQDRLKCRKLLGLPENDPLMGYVGSWARIRGTDMLLDAFRKARAAHPNLKLVLSGRPPDYALREPGVIGTGYVSDDLLPTLVSALDVACVVTADNRFGRYSYPAKLCEAMACGIPVVATATEPVRWMLNGKREHLAPAGDTGVFAQRIADLLASPSAEYGPRTTWLMQAQRLDYLLKSADSQI